MKLRHRGGLDVDEVATVTIIVVMKLLLRIGQAVTSFFKHDAGSDLVIGWEQEVWREHEARLKSIHVVEW